MRNFLLLLKVQILSVLSMIFMGGARNKSKKKVRASVAGYIAFYLFFLVFASVYIYMFSMSFSMAGALDAMPGLIVTASSVLSLLSSMSVSKLLIFCSKDYDLTTVLPVNTKTIVAAKTASLYIYDLLSTSLLMLPSGVIYGIFAKPSPLFYVMFYVMMFFVPAIPIVLGSVIGALFSYVSAHFKKANLISTVLYVALFAGIFYFSFSAGNMSEEQFDALIVTYGSLASIYPPAKWFTSACVSLSVVDFLCFTLISAAFCAALIFVFGTFYKKFHTLFLANFTKSAYRFSGGKTSASSALVKKEASKILSSPNLLINSLVGVMMMTVLTFAAIFKWSDLSATLPEALNALPASIVAYGAGMCALMSSTTNTSISLEGKTLHILKSAPLSANRILFSKLKAHMLLCCPIILIDCVVLSFVLGLSLPNALISIVIPLLFSYVSGVFGLLINLKKYSFDWTNEIQVVKQSFPVMVTALGGMFGGMAVMACGVVSSITSQLLYYIVSSVIILIFAGVATALTVILSKNGERLLRELS